MKPTTIGRILGIGVRVAGRAAVKTAAAAAQPAPGQTRSAAATREAGRAAGQASRGVARGVGGFLRPFGRVGGILWLEVMGVFFFLPVLVFGPTVWRNRAYYAAGPGHHDFLIAAFVVAVFLYLSISSFWRAQRKSSKLP